MSSSDEAGSRSGSPSSVLAELVDRLTAQLQAGAAVDWDAVEREHPEHADELRCGASRPPARRPASPAADEGLAAFPTARAGQAPQPPLAGAAVPNHDRERDGDILPASVGPADPGSPDNREPAVPLADAPAAAPERKGEPGAAALDAFFEGVAPAERGSIRPGAAVPGVGGDVGPVAGAVAEGGIGKGAVVFALLGTLWGTRAEGPESRRRRQQRHV
jgi:hypothetical protein